MNILFIAPSAYPLGGVATWLDYIIPGLGERAWNVTFGLVEGRFHDVDAYLEMHPHDNVLRIPCGTGTHEGRVRQLVRAIDRMRPDIVLTVNIADVVPAVGRIRAVGEWSPRLAMTLHAVQPDYLGLIQNCAAGLDAVVCPNRLACELVERAVDPDRVYYAPYGVEMADTPAKNQMDSDDILRIAYVGRFERAQKRIQDVPKVVAELNRRGVAFHLLIAGSGPDEHWLRAELSELVGKGRVRLVGALTGPELVGLYSRTNVLLITSYWETGPIVAWEAMAKGVAVVTSAYIGSGLENSLVDGDNCLMFPVGDIVAAADCLERLQDKELHIRVAQAGLGLVARRYSRMASIEQWDASLRKIATKSPLGALSRLTNTTRSPAGRLDRLFGRQAGETIRELLGLSYNHSEPGGEWPHTSLYSPVHDDEFWHLAMSQDRRPTGQAIKP